MEFKYLSYKGLEDVQKKIDSIYARKLQLMDLDSRIMDNINALTENIEDVRNTYVRTDSVFAITEKEIKNLFV